MHFDAQRVRQNAQRADTQDLLDRVTAYRSGMEPAAVTIIEAELQRRGVGAEAIAAHSQRATLQLPDGCAVRCSCCERPAVARRWGWQRLWGRVPVFPRPFRVCERHLGG